MTQTLSQAGAAMYQDVDGAEGFDPEAADPAAEQAAEDETTVEGEFREVGN